MIMHHECIKFINIQLTFSDKVILFNCEINNIPDAKCSTTFSCKNSRIRINCIIIIIFNIVSPFYMNGKRVKYSTSVLVSVHNQYFCICSMY